jgi:hypothetical protein
MPETCATWQNESRGRTDPNISEFFLASWSGAAILAVREFGDEATADVRLLA